MEKTSKQREGTKKKALYDNNFLDQKEKFEIQFKVLVKKQKCEDARQNSTH